MTDQPTTYNDGSGVRLNIDAARGWGKPDHVAVSIRCGCLDPSGDGHELSMFVPTARMLAMIDAEDPDAMRAYLRETAPEVIADLYRPAPAAADHFDYLDNIPEADTPEDVDERPASGVEGRLYVIERLARVLRDGTDAELVTALADWVLDR